MKRFIFLAALLSACNWTDFDKLSDQTWVHAQGKPSIGSTDYAVSIVGASTSGDGGLVAVVSTDAPTYSTVSYDAKGTSKTGDTVLKLGQHYITSLSEKPILVTDGMGNVALVEKAIDANQIAVVSGPANSPVDLTFPGSPPQAATYAGSALIIAAASAAPGGANLFIVDGANPVKNCTATAPGATTALSAAAIAADATRLWVWSKDGSVFSYDLAMVKGCTGMLAATAGSSYTPAAPFVPGTGARIHIIGDGATELAVLAGHADKATNGEVVVLSVPASGAPTVIPSSISADGLLSSTIAMFDGMTYLVLGYPQKSVKGVTGGEVDIHELDPTTGMLTATPAATLSDAQPDNGELFGRDVTTMEFNGQTVLVVAASNDVFSYYRTSLYPTDTRNPAP